MQLPELSRRQAGPRVACSDPPPADGTTPALALVVQVFIVAPRPPPPPARAAAAAPPGTPRAAATSRCSPGPGATHGALWRAGAAAPATMPVENDVPEPFP